MCGLCALTVLRAARPSKESETSSSSNNMKIGNEQVLEGVGSEKDPNPHPDDDQSPYLPYRGG